MTPSKGSATTADDETVFIDNVCGYYTINDLSTLRVKVEGDNFEMTLFNTDGAHVFALTVEEQDTIRLLLTKMHRRRQPPKPFKLRP